MCYMKNRCDILKDLGRFSHMKFPFIQKIPKSSTVAERHMYSVSILLLATLYDGPLLVPTLTCCPSLISIWVLCGQCWQLDIPSSIRLLKARGFNLLVHTVWACCASWRLFMWQSTKVTGQQSVRTWGFQLWSKWAWQQTFHLAICLPSASKAAQSQKCLVTEVL